MLQKPLCDRKPFELKSLAFHYSTSKRHAVRKPVQRCTRKLKKHWYLGINLKIATIQNECSFKNFPVF